MLLLTPRSAVRCSERVARQRRACSSGRAPEPDPYEELGVSPSSSAAEIRAAYVALQRRYHPDVAGDAGLDRSRRLNAAYELLTNPTARRNYAGSSNRTRRASAPAPRQPGVVGPLATETLLEVRAPASDDDDYSTLDEVRDAVREWSKTLAFTTELPLPSPLIVDQTEDGCRIAVCAATLGASGRPEMAGALDFMATEECDFEGKRCSWLFSVTRSAPLAAAGKPLAGEGRLLRAMERELRAALAARRRPAPQSGLALPRFLDFLSPFLLPLTSLGLLGDSAAGGYSGYRIRRSCRLDERPEASEDMAASDGS